MGKMKKGDITMPCADAAVRAVEDRQTMNQTYEAIVAATIDCVDILIDRAVGVFDTGDRSTEGLFSEFLNHELVELAIKKGKDAEDLRLALKDDLPKMVAAIEETFSPFRVQIEAAMSERTKELSTWVERTYATPSEREIR